MRLVQRCKVFPTAPDVVKLPTLRAAERRFGDRTPAMKGLVSVAPDSPPYLRDGRCLTLEDTIEFFNLVLGLKPTQEEKQDLVAFLRQP